MEWSLQQISKETGIKTGNISNYVKRGNLVRNSKGNFDLYNEKNRLFLERRGIELYNDNNSSYSSEDDIRELQRQKRQITEQYEYAEANRGGSLSQIEKAIKTLTANKLKRDVEILTIKLEKLKGSVIPTDLVQMALAQQFKSAAVAFKNGVDKFISIIAKESDMTHEQKNKLRGELVNIINEAINESVDMCKVQVDSIVSEFQETRGKGERK